MIWPNHALFGEASPVPVSYGNAADDRYATRAAGCRSGGGSSSPVYADGVVYVAFYASNRSVDTDWIKAYESRRSSTAAKASRSSLRK